MNPNKIIHTSDFEKKPRWFVLINKIWGGIRPVPLLKKDDLIRNARNKTGLHDLGSDFFDEALDRMLWSINHEARLHPIGHFITVQRLTGLLATRLRAEYWFKKHPEILEQELYPAWIIMGLQRTGTTKLHRLLGADPRNRIVSSWEAINPAPPVHSQTLRDKRIKMAKTAANAVRYMSPGFYAIHPIEVFEPEEDILLLDAGFMSTTAEAMMHVPTYADWVEKTNPSPAYAYEVKLLKLLQWQKPAERWILKTPHHMEFTRVIEKHFPDVRFIWPHRNVYESIPSFLSMVCYNRSLFSNEVNVTEVARHWLRKTQYILERALEHRNEEGNEMKFTDVFYDDLVRDAMGEMGKIYNMDHGLTPELVELFSKNESAHPYRKYGIHKYSLEDFGISRAEIDICTATYREFLGKRYNSDEA